MLRDAGRFCLVLLVLLLAHEAQALSLLRARTQLCSGLCSDGPVDTGPGAMSSFSFDYGGSEQNLLASAAAAIADYDQFGFQTGAEIDFVLGPGDAPAVVLQGVGGRAFIELWDVLTVSGGSGVGTVRMQWQISGGIDIGFVGSNSVVATNATSELRLICTSNVGPSILNCNDPVFGFSASQSFDELVTLDIQVLFGMPTQWFLDARLASGLSFQADGCDTCVVAFQGRANADFSSTARLVDVQLFDGAGNELDPSLIQAESSFRYDLVGRDVPEPLANAWAALAALGLRRLAMRPRVS